MSNRHADGSRKNASNGTKFHARQAAGRPGRRTIEEKVALGGKLHTKRDADPQADGEALREQVYLPPVLANPGNVIACNAGGGHMGSKLAHENEAPFPQKLADFFIRSFCPPGGIACDPFSGSGTTVDAAIRAGRRAIGFDVRESQVDLSRRRAEIAIAETDQPRAT